MVNDEWSGGQALENAFRVADEELRKVERERDAAVARADQLRDERDGAVQSCITVGRARDEWRARAEAAEARTATAVTRDEVEKAIGSAGEWLALTPRDQPRWHTDRDAAADAVWALVTGADPAVFVVRESDVAAVQVTRDSHGEWFADGEHVYVDDARQAIHIANDYIAKAVRRFAVARAIEAEQAADPDPVEDKARELYRAATPDARWETVADEYRRIARHVLGQEDAR